MKTLYVFVEGADDERFFNWYFNQQHTVIVPYAQMKKEKINALINSINRIFDVDYILLADADYTSVLEKINVTLNRFEACERNKIFIVQREIESWYLAGFPSSACRKWHIHYYSHTNEVVKEDFDRMKPNNFGRIHFMLEILKRFDVLDAVERNTTFYYFCKRCNR